MSNQKPTQKDRLANATPEVREVIAENMKERVYSTITLLAVLTVLWQNAEHHRVVPTILTILGSVVALWLATLISIRLSYRAVHGQPIGMSSYRKALFAASGLLAPAVTPILIIAISGLTNWYHLKAALLASMIVSLLSLFLISFTAGRKIYNNLGRLLIVSTLEMSVGVGVILLKIVTGE